MKTNDKYLEALSEREFGMSYDELDYEQRDQLEEIAKFESMNNNL